MSEAPVDVVVVDASTIVDALVNGQPSFVGKTLAAPAHLDAEVLSALGRLQRQGVLTVIDVEEMLDDLSAIAMTRVPIAALVGHAFALRENVALRDALYVVVAQALDARLLTSDTRLASTCRALDLCAVHQ